jgi:uncharacterized protein with PIN domain
MARVVLVCSYCGAELATAVADELRKEEIESLVFSKAPDACPKCGARLYGVVEWSKIFVEFVPRLARRLA